MTIATLILNLKRRDRPTQDVFDYNGSDSESETMAFRARKPLKLGRKDERIAKSAEVQASKRDRDQDGKDSVRKRKKGSSGTASNVEQNGQKWGLQNASHTNEAAKEKHLSVPNGDGKEDVEKFAQVPNYDTAKELTKKSLKQRIGEENLLSQLSEPVPEKKGPRREREDRPKKAIVHPESGLVKEAVSPHKPRKSTQIWIPKDEIALFSEVLNHVKFDADIPNKKSDDFWAKLYEQLQGKLEMEWNRDQLCDKVKRMKARYYTMADKVRESDKPYKHRNSTDSVLFSLWSQIWGKAECIISKANEDMDEGKEEADTVVASACDADRIRENRSTRGKTEPDAPEGKQSKKKSGETHKLISGRSDDRRTFAGIGLAIKPKECMAKASAVQNVDTRRSMRKEPIPQSGKSSKTISNGFNLQADGNISDPLSDIQRLLPDGVRPLLQEMQGNSKIILEEWLAKATSFIEDALRASRGNSALVSRWELIGNIGSSSPPWRSWELKECQFSNREPAFQQQLDELHIQELDVYSQRLRLLQQECKLKQEKLRLQLERGKLI